MSTASSAAIANLELDRTVETPLYRQLYQRIREAILRGQLPPGARLPSTRGLAAQLAASRATVEIAYGMLAGEGYVIGHGPAGTQVAPGLAAAKPPARPSISTGTRGTGFADTTTAPLPFQMGLPALDAFPRKLWARLTARHGRALSSATLAYPPTGGHPALRAEIASYLGVARGVACGAEQVLITAGFQGALGLIAGALLQPREAVWVEDPGYFLTRRALTQAAARLIAVPVDGDGLDVAAGLKRAPRARLAVVTPSHQAPLGVALSLPRRLALLEWARAAGAWIVEDDYDSEFRYAGRPLPALKSLDRGDRVLYVGSFSKVLFPGLRLGYVVAPSAVIGRLAAAAEALGLPPPLLHQAMVADFMASGHFGRHIRRMRGLYAARRAALLVALRSVPGTQVADPPPGGLQLLLRLAKGQDDVACAQRARAHGLAPQPLSVSAIRAKQPPGLLLGFTNLPVEQAADTVRRLRRALNA